jgi:hypothetical protein
LAELYRHPLPRQGCARATFIMFFDLPQDLKAAEAMAS